MKVTYSQGLVVALAIAWSGFSGLAFGEGEADENVDPNVEVVKQITAAMVDAAEDSYSQVRQAAVSYLANEKSEVAMDVFRTAIDDEDDNVRIEAIKGMVKVAGPTDEVLRTLMNSLADPVTANVARQLIRDVGDPAVPVLIKAITEDSPQKNQAIELLGSMNLQAKRYADVVSVLVRSLKDENSERRLAPALSLASVKEEIQNLDPHDPRYGKYEQYARSYIRKYDIDCAGSSCSGYDPQTWLTANYFAKNFAQTGDGTSSLCSVRPSAPVTGSM